jgi:hypothetical protein
VQKFRLLWGGDPLFANPPLSELSDQGQPLTTIPFFETLDFVLPFFSSGECFGRKEIDRTPGSKIKENNTTTTKTKHRNTHSTKHNEDLQYFLWNAFFKVFLCLRCVTQENSHFSAFVVFPTSSF